MSVEPSQIDDLQNTIAWTNQAVQGGGASSTNGSDGDGHSTPGASAAAIAVQSVAQSMAIAIADATDMLRNVSTVATTAIGVASAKWIEEPEQVLYASIIETSQATITTAAEAFATIGAASGQILQNFPQGDSSSS